MLNKDTRFCPNSNEVAGKVMDGEAILINLDTGAYYSMDNVGAVIWQFIDERRSVEEMLAGITAQYDVSAAQAESDILRILGELVDEKLASTTTEGPTTTSSAIDPPNPRLPYQTPCLNSYHDMRALLALDPPPPLMEDVPQYAGDSSNDSKV